MLELEGASFVFVLVAVVWIIWMLFIYNHEFLKLTFVPRIA